MRPGVVVVGTAHVSAKSVEQVEATIRERKPDAVLVELDERRFEALKDPDAWQKTDIIQVLREKKQHLFLLQLYLASMQARMGRETGVAPGGEMLRAIEVADELGAEVVLIDRDVSITLKRGFASMGFWRRMRLFWNVTLDVLTPADPNEKVDVDDLLETDAITQMTEEFARFAPDIKTALIDERDAYMASHIDAQDKAGRTCVAVVGAGHCPGIQRHLEASEVPERAPLDELPTPPAISVGKVLGIGVPLLILGLFAYLGYQGYQEGNYSDFLDSIQTWVFLNGGLAALGALLAGGHLFSIIAAFIAAPITSLNPALAAGWFAGLTEAKVRTPTVGDFQAIKHMETFRDFRRNGVVRVILVTALANLGSAIATWVAGAQIVRTVLGS